MRTIGRLTILLGTALLVAAPSAGTLAQDPSAAPMCSVLSAQEIKDALGVEVAITDGDDVECTYETGEASTETLLVSSRRSADTLDEQRGFFEGEDIEVGGAAALFVPGLFSRELYVSTSDGGSYTLQVVGATLDDGEARSAMTDLATLAMSRLPGLGPLPTEEPIEPGQTFARDPELEAKFPSQVGGVPVTVSSYSLADVGTQTEIVPELQAALAATGKSLADVRIGIGFFQDAAGQPSSITAVQVKGADAAALKAALLPAVFTGRTIGPETSLQVGGKDVTSLDVDGTTTYIHAKDDILWAVTASEPALTEILLALP